MLRLEAAAPLTGIRCLRTPSRTLRPPLRRRAYWRLLSHLNLNHLSLTDPVEGRAALQELLSLYDFSDPEAGQQRMRAKPAVSHAYPVLRGEVRRDPPGIMAIDRECDDADTIRAVTEDPQRTHARNGVQPDAQPGRQGVLVGPDGGLIEAAKGIARGGQGRYSKDIGAARLMPLR